MIESLKRTRISTRSLWMCTILGLAGLGASTTDAQFPVEHEPAEPFACAPNFTGSYGSSGARRRREADLSINEVFIDAQGIRVSWRGTICFHDIVPDLAACVDQLNFEAEAPLTISRDRVNQSVTSRPRDTGGGLKNVSREIQNHSARRYGCAQRPSHLCPSRYDNLEW